MFKISHKVIYSVLLLSTFIGVSIHSANQKTVKADSHSDFYRSSFDTYFVDSYKSNIADNKTPQSNAAIGLLSQHSKLWTPGTTWNNGTIRNAKVLNENIQKVLDIAQKRTPEQERAAYFDDRRNQSYSVIDGLGKLADEYKTLAKATTSINDIPTDATTKSYNDEGSYGDPTAKLGEMVKLVQTMRGKYSSTNPAKSYFQYPRPFRWQGNEIVEQVANNKVTIPTLIPEISRDPSTDGGFPSGHTNAAYLTAYAMAYAYPQRYTELLTRASELGNNRIVAGMHSPLDVMGGRVLATALAAAILNDPDNQKIKREAYREGQQLLKNTDGQSSDRFSNYQKNRQQFDYRLSYGFAPTQSSRPSRVPKGAEVLLETRFPYMNKAQRRTVLGTTALRADYPLLDDPEGWGKLNLFAAASGYGKFNRSTKVSMNADKGGFNANDVWQNNITGPGSLEKLGTGKLTLTGNNSYRGGTKLEGGTLVAKNSTALGNGNVKITRGTLQLSKKSTVVKGNYYQYHSGKLVFTHDHQSLKVKGKAIFGGKLNLAGVDTHSTRLISYKSRSGKFTYVSGLPKHTKLIYTKNYLKLTKS